MAIATQSTGKSIISTTFGTFNSVDVSGIARFNSDGTLDNTFGTSGVAVVASTGYRNIGAMEIQLDGKIVAAIENKAGSQGSLAVYNHLAQTYGSITAEAAKKGLELYAEHTEDARLHAGKHPNIDRLIAIAEGGPGLRVKHLFAPA